MKTALPARDTPPEDDPRASKEALARADASPWPFDFKRDYLSARGFDLAAREAGAQRLYDEGPERLVAYARTAAARLDLEALLVSVQVLRRHGGLTWEIGLAYADALMAEGRYAEAIGPLRDLLIEQPGSPNHLFTLAEALAACGEFEDAAQAALAVPTTWHKRARAETLAERAEAMTDLRDRQADLSWTEGRLFVEGCMGLKAVAVAEAALRRLLDRPPGDEPSRDDIVGLARSGHALKIRHRRLWGLVKQLWRTNPDDAAVCAVRIESLVLWGYSEAVDLARSPPIVQPQSSKLDRLARSYAAAAAHVVAGELEPAIRLLGAIYMRNRKDVAAYNALQAVMGQYVLGGLDLPWAAPRPPKVINLLPYFNERTLLEMRLAEMGDWVDHFVIVEASTTFTGLPKPLHFEAYQGMFADRGDQLLHVPIREVPECCDTAWARDMYQRDMAVRALAGLWRPDDIILITDADEIVDRRALKKFRPRLAVPRMVTSKFFLNYVARPGHPQNDRRSGVVCQASVLARFGSTYLRSLAAGGKRWDSLPAAGWHFTSLGDAAAVLAKFNAYAHQENNKLGLRSEDGVAALLASIHAGIDEPGWQRLPIDSRFPTYVVEQQEMLHDRILESG